jgi:hypothetical protein
MNHNPSVVMTLNGRVSPRELLNRANLYGQTVDDFCERHQRFSRRQNAEQPLIGLYRHSIYPMLELIEYLGEEEVHPEDIDAERWLHVYEQTWENTGLMWGDLVYWAAPLNGFPWLEAILGCSIHVSRESNSVWAEPPTDFRLGDEVRLDPKNAWFQKLLQATEALVKLSAGRFPVASGIMRGISDLMAALLDSTKFYLTLYDQPEKLSQLAQNLAETWIKVVSAQYELIPTFSKGYVNAGLWTPGPCPVYQEDAASLISSEIFEGIIAPYSRQVLTSFECPIMHLHSEGLQIIDSFLGIENQPVIEVNIDPTGPPLNELIPIFKTIQDMAPLEIFGTVDEIHTCLEELSYDGLACLILESSLEVVND